MDPETPLKASTSAKIAVLQRRGEDGQVLPGKIGSVKDVEIPSDYYCKCRQLKSSCSVCNEGWRQRSLPGLTLVNGKAVPCTASHPEAAPMPVASSGSSERITDTFQSPMSSDNVSPVCGDNPVLDYLDKDLDREGLGTNYSPEEETTAIIEFPDAAGLTDKVRAEMRITELVHKLEEAEAANAATRVDLERERRDNAQALQATSLKGEEANLRIKQLDDENLQHQLRMKQLDDENLQNQLQMKRLDDEKLQWITSSEEREAQRIMAERKVEVSKHEKEVLLRDTELQMKQQLEEREAQLRITMQEKQDEELAQLRITLNELRKKEAAHAQELAEQKAAEAARVQELLEQKAAVESAHQRITREKANIMKHLHETEKNYWWAEETLGKAVAKLDVNDQASREFLQEELTADWWPEGFDPSAKADGPKPESREGVKEDESGERVQDTQKDGTSDSHEAPQNMPNPPSFPKDPASTPPPSDARKAAEHSPGSGAGWGNESKAKWGSTHSSPSAPEKDDRWKRVEKPEWEKERDRIQAERDAARAAEPSATNSPPRAQPPSSSAPKSRVKREPSGGPDDDDESSESSDEERKDDDKGDEHEGRDWDYGEKDPPRGSKKDYDTGGSGKPPGKGGPGGDDKDDGNGRKANSDQSNINVMASAMLNAVEKMAEIAERSSGKGWKSKGNEDRKYHPKSLEANKSNIGHANISGYSDIDQTFKYRHIWMWRDMEKEIEKYLLLLYNSEDVGKNVWRAIQEGVDLAQDYYHKAKDQKEKMTIEPSCNFHAQEEQVSRDLWLQLHSKFPPAVQTRVQEKKESHGRATGRLEDAVFLMRIWCTPTTVPQKEECRLKFSKKLIDWTTLESGKERLNIILIKWRQNLRVLEDCGAINKDKTSYEPFLRQLRDSTKPGAMPDARVGDGFNLDMMQLYRSFKYDEDHVSQKELDDYIDQIQTIYAREVDLFSDTKPAYLPGRSTSVRKLKTPPRKDVGTFKKRPWFRSPGSKSPAAATANVAEDFGDYDDGDYQDYYPEEGNWEDDQEPGDEESEQDAQSEGEPVEDDDQEAGDYYYACPESAYEVFFNAQEEVEEDPEGELQDYEYYCPLEGYHYAWGPDDYYNYLTEPGFCYSYVNDPKATDDMCFVVQWYRRCADESCRCKVEKECKNQGRDSEGKLFKCDHPGCPRPIGHNSKACRKKFDWLEKVYLRAKRELKGPPKGKGKGKAAYKGKSKGESKGQGKGKGDSKGKDKKGSGKGEPKGKGKGGKKGAANPKGF